MRSPRCLLRVSLLLPILVLWLASCRSTNQLLKAKPVALSPFIEHPHWMRDHREHVPFHLLWMTGDPAAAARAGQKSEIYIAPVSLRYLRPLKKPLVRKEVEAGSIDRREHEMARRLRSQFALAFAEVPPSRY